MSLVSDISAQILAAGQARAAGQRRSGEIWGSTLANIGQTIGQLPAQIQQSKIAEQDQKIKAQEMSIRQSQADALTRAQKISEQADGIVSNLMTQQPDGSFTPDRAKLTAAFTESKIPIEQQAKWFTHFDAIDESNSKFAKQRSESIADTANSAIKSIKDGADPDSAVAFAIGITKANHPNITTEQFKPIIDAIAAGQDPVKVLTSARDALSTKYKDQEKPVSVAAGGTLVNPVTGEAVFTAPSRPVSVAPGGTLVNPSSGEAVFTAPVAEKPDARSLALQANDAQQRGDTAEYNRLLKVIKETGQADDRPTRVSINAGGEGGDFSPDSIVRMATEVRMLGNSAMPTRLSRGDKVAIENEVSRQDKAVGNSAAQSITKRLINKADTAALTQLTKIASAAESFENKALAQADIISDLSRKVPRTKFPIINSMLQSGRTEITGDADATKLANAISTFTAEYSKIMEGSTASASGSSDSSRKEAARLINTAMSKGTMQSVLDLMKQEMRLTINGFDYGKKTITDRIGGQPQPQQTQQPAEIWDRVKKAFVPNPNYRP